MADVSSKGNLMSARSLGRRRHDESSLQRPAADAAGVLADEACAGVKTQASNASAASVSVTQSGAFPVRHGISNGASRPGLMSKSSLTMERFPASATSLGARRSLSLVKPQTFKSLAAASSTALQLTGAPLQRLSSSAADEHARLFASSNSFSSLADRPGALQNGSLPSSQLLPSTAAASLGTAPNCGSLMPAAKVPAARAKLSNMLGKLCSVQTKMTPYTCSDRSNVAEHALPFLWLVRCCCTDSSAVVLIRCTCHDCTSRMCLFLCRSCLRAANASNTVSAAATKQSESTSSRTAMLTMPHTTCSTWSKRSM